jgi:hypothetical protein
MIKGSFEMDVIRYVGQIDFGGEPWPTVLKSNELFASKVAPEIRKHLNYKFSHERHAVWRLYLKDLQQRF